MQFINRQTDKWRSKQYVPPAVTNVTISKVWIASQSVANG